MKKSKVVSIVLMFVAVFAFASTDSGNNADNEIEECKTELSEDFSLYQNFQSHRRYRICVDYKCAGREHRACVEICGYNANLALGQMTNGGCVDNIDIVSIGFCY